MIKGSSLAGALGVTKFITSFAMHSEVGLWIKGSSLAAALGVTKFKTLRGRFVEQKHELGLSSRSDQVPNIQNLIYYLSQTFMFNKGKELAYLSTIFSTP